jgi:flagellar M-ring protein FliF
VLSLATGRVLDPGQVDAIVHLVSSSVPGMARNDVTVVDQTGRLVSRNDGDEAGQLNDRQLRHRAEVEERLRRRIEALLTPLVGQGNLSVEVTAAMDYTQREITEERVDPEGNALRSEQRTEAETRDAPAGGIPGAVANTPPLEAELEKAGPNQPGAAPGAVRNRTSGSTLNYEVSRTVQSIRPETGQITRLSAAVVIRAPAAAPAPTEDGALEEAPATGIDPAMMDDWRRLVESAIGFDEARGDAVTIVAQPFAIPDLPEPVLSGSGFEWLTGALREAVLIAVLAIVGLGFVRPLLLRQTSQTNPMLPTGGTTVEVAEGESLSDVEAKLDRRHKDLASSVLGNRATRAEKQAVLRHLVAEDPVRIAMVMHRMIKPELDSVR